MEPIDLLSKEDISRKAAALAEAGSTEPFIRLVQTIREAPDGDRMSVAEELANLDTIQSQGVVVGDGFRIAPRWFEMERRAGADDLSGEEPIVVFEGGAGSVAYGGKVITVMEAGHDGHA